MKTTKEFDKTFDKTFDVPQGYFDLLGDRINASLDAHKRRRRSKLVRMYALRVSGAAALLAGLMFAVVVFLGDTFSSNQDVAITQDANNDFVIKITKAPELPVNSPELQSLIQEEGLSVIKIDEDRTILIDSSAVADYLTNNYDIMELATL